MEKIIKTLKPNKADRDINIKKPKIEAKIFVLGIACETGMIVGHTLDFKSMDDIYNHLTKDTDLPDKSESGAETSADIKLSVYNNLAQLSLNSGIAVTVEHAKAVTEWVIGDAVL
nr:MAG: hypothetical protein [Bacteriophage sp.]